MKINEKLIESYLSISGSALLGVWEHVAKGGRNGGDFGRNSEVATEMNEKSENGE